MNQEDYDTPWKDILESYFTDFMAFFFPKAYNDIDWEKSFEFLDKELQQIMQDSEIGKRLVDKLVKVWRKDSNQEEWLLIHLEVQSQKEKDFEKRMYVYNYRLFDRYNRMVASMAVLGDENASWRPNAFRYELWECEVSVKFPMVKILDYRDHWKELEESNNPFAIVVMAHLKTQETHKNMGDRKLWKIKLIRLMYERNYKRKDIIGIFKFIDWSMRLPKKLEDDFWQDLKQFEEEKRMPYITSVERIGIEKGRKEERKNGLLDAIELGLDLKFGAEGLKLVSEIREINDIDILKAIRSKIKPAKSLDELREIYKNTFDVK